MGWVNCLGCLGGLGGFVVLGGLDWVGNREALLWVIDCAARAVSSHNERNQAIPSGLLPKGTNSTHNPIIS